MIRTHSDIDQAIRDGSFSPAMGQHIKFLIWVIQAQEVAILRKGKNLPDWANNILYNAERVGLIANGVTRAERESLGGDHESKD